MDIPVDIAIASMRFEETYEVEFDALYINLNSSKPKYPAKQHARSVAKHLGLKKGLVYLLGTPTRIGEDSDMPVAFKQRRYFYYMSGVNFEDCVLTYDIEKDDLRLYIPEPDLLSVIWLGATPSKVECEERYEVDQVKYNTGIDGYVSKWVQQNSDGIVLILHPRQVPQVLKRDEWKDLKEKGVINSTLLQPAMDAARVIKSEYEIEQIRRANDISSAAHRRVLETLVTAKNETEIHGIFEGSCICAGAKKQAYAPIVGSGENASTLHYDANNQNLAGKELVCVDAGCEWENYASDITRTFPISGSFSEEAKEIYSIVEDMQEQCISKIAPGVLYRNLHNLAMEIGIKGLMDLGILCNGAYDEILKSGSGRAFFPHGLGHHIGLECHDVSGPQRLLLESSIHEIALWGPGITQDRMEGGKDYDKGNQQLEANMVVTVEPGLYFNRYAMENGYLHIPDYAKHINTEILEKYYPVGGVRIEDDILVTEDGYENLTTAPKGEVACEIIRQDKIKATAARDSPSKRFWEFKMM